jgi:hypothetical protein
MTMDDHDDLVAKHSMPWEEMSPEQREWVLRVKQRDADQEAAGKVGSPEQFARQNTPLGLDDNYVPFPVTPKENKTRAADPDGWPKHDPED